MKILFGLLFLAPLATQAETVFEKKHDEPLVMAVKTKDPEFEKSINEAQSSLQFFFELYKEYKNTSGVYFMVKLPLSNEGNTNHFWYHFKGVDKDVVTAEHFKLPAELMKYKTMSVNRKVVEDWMINDHGHLYGGYSIRLQRERLPENERAKFDEYAGIEVYKKNDFK